MDKFLVLGVVLILQLDISKGNPVAQFYDQNGIGKYEVHYSNASWDDAKQICKDGGGNLAVIRTVFDEMIVKNIVATETVPFVWLGLHEVRQSAIETHWETASDDWVNLKTSGAWKLNLQMDKKILYAMPEDGIVKECGLYVISSLDFGVIPAPCEFTAPFICHNK